MIESNPQCVLCKEFSTSANIRGDVSDRALKEEAVGHECDGMPRQQFRVIFRMSYWLETGARVYEASSNPPQMQKARRRSAQHGARD